MDPLATWRAYLDLRRRRSDRAIRARQERALVSVVEHAVMTVPFWRERFAAAGLGAGDIRSLEDLAKVPVLRRNELAAADPAAVVSAAWNPAALRAERTRGTSGPPFTVRLDPGFVAVRSALFLRALAAAGYRPGQRLLLVTTRVRRRDPLRRWLHASVADEPERLLEDLNRFRPAVVFGSVGPLRRVARLVRASGGLAHRPRAVVTTSEALGPSSRRALRDAFASEPHDAYGLAEAGMIAWECERHVGYHVSEETAIVELLPTEEGGEERRVVVTNLALRGMPLLRLDTGDLAIPGSGEPCACGRGRIRLARIEGRAVDCVRLADGRTISPYRFTLALERIDGIERYQVLQEGLEEFVVRVEAPAFDEAIATRVRHALRDLVGPAARISVRPEDRLAVSPDENPRAVESRLGVAAVPGGAAQR